MSINTRGNRVARPASDFEMQLDRQMGFLRRSCKAYDAGAHDEAVRIALTIRVLVHNTKHSTALLHHLGIQNTLQYVDTGVYRNDLTAARQAMIDKISPGWFPTLNPVDVGLVELGSAGQNRVGWFAPLRLERFPGPTRGSAAFDSWWNDPLVESSSRKSFSRSHLILIMANQDGGGHVDAAIDADYKDLIIDPLMQAEQGPEAKKKVRSGHLPDVLHNVAFASVRQIAFELICTIDRYNYVKANPGLFILANPFGGLKMPEPPHQPIINLHPMVIGKPE